MSQIPLPTPYQDTAEYWQAAKDHRFVVQKCRDCGEHQFYPRGVCSHCLSSDLEWREASGKATVYSYSVNYRAGHPGFAAKTPFVLALVELAEGPRMMTNIVNCDPESVRIGMAVTVCYDDVTDEVTLPMFQPA
ncbi:MAG: Zn-ribbon domain-containing OB-fold protein [Alphaproteobacteria bacterium]|nr:Zn-ribbon domain-containing OB-fold protein [Alphaproteobacteria bacterium]MCB9930626.1 Zn-ribbon domain-containing OB-fold protein [Alphaproteobacteria bacterium]